MKLRFDQPVFTTDGAFGDLGDDWDIGIEHIVTMPYSTTGGMFGETDLSPEFTARTSIDFDRVPKGECEIRRESTVVSADDHTVGIVEGFMTDESDIEGIIVRTGWIGFRHLVVVPVASVARVTNDCITITLQSDEFYRLHPVEELETIRSPRGRIERFEHLTAQRVKGLRERIRTLLHRDEASGEAST